MTARRSRDQRARQPLRCAAGAPSYPWASREDRQVEAALLGTAVAFPGSARDMLSGIEARDLGDPTHRIVLGVMRWMLNTGQPTEAVLLAAALQRHAGAPHPTGRSWPVVVADLLHVAGHPALQREYVHALLEARLRWETACFAARLEQVAAIGTSKAVYAALSAATRQLGLTLARLAETASAAPDRPPSGQSRRQPNTDRPTTTEVP